MTTIVEETIESGIEDIIIVIVKTNRTIKTFYSNFGLEESLRQSVN